ncbi:MAG TPA: serine/threonine-protein kinase, partial [Polyangiaceae bacterium]|nr:serine/threonine-protein kinase [Polyangiaceae bacterium]
VEHGDEADFVKLLDFGLVKRVSGDSRGEELTQAGLFMGSPKYMAPEQIRGDKVDARTDIYALGIIMYEMITGKVPFDRPNSVNILMAHVNEEAPALRQMNPNVNVSPAIEDTVARCMAKDPDQRFRSMDEVLASLKRVGGGAMTATISGVGTGEYRALSGSGSGPQVTTNGVSGANPAFLSPTTTSDPGSIPSPLAVPSDSPAAGASPLMSQPPGKSGSKGMLVAAVVGALAIAGIIGFVALRPAKPQSATTPTPTTTAQAPDTATATAAPPPTTTAAQPSLVKVRVNTDPDGASVKEDGVELCSSTPCDILYKGADADPTREHKLSFTRNGYRVENKTVKVGDSPVNVKLTVAPAGPIYRPAQPKENAAPVPTGYKNDIPY